MKKILLASLFISSFFVSTNAQVYSNLTITGVSIVQPTNGGNFYAVVLVTEDQPQPQLQNVIDGFFFPIGPSTGIFTDAAKALIASLMYAHATSKIVSIHRVGAMPNLSTHNFFPDLPQTGYDILCSADWFITQN